MSPAELSRISPDPRQLPHFMTTRSLIALSGLACLAGFTSAQDFKTPKEVENPSEQLEIPAGPTDEAAEANVGPEVVMIPSLRGIWVHRSITAVESEVEPFDGLRIAEHSGVTKTAVFQDIFKPHLGKPLTDKSLSRLIREVSAHYHLLDYPFAELVVPEQDITEGVLQVVLRESRIDDILVRGNEHFSEEYVRRVMRARSGEMPHVPSIFEDANWLSANPFLRVQPIFGPGGEESTTHLFLEVEDARPLRTYATFSNEGNDLTGELQYGIGANYGNFLGRGHQIGYQYTTGDIGGGLKAHALSYQLPLHSLRQYLRFNASFTDTEATVGGLDISGETQEFAVMLRHPFRTLSSGLEHHLDFGFEWKRSRNALEFGVVPVNDDAIQISQLVLGYNAKWKDERGSNALGVAVLANLPGLFPDQSDGSYNAVRPGADSDYRILRIKYLRETRLPWQLLLRNHLSFQVADSKVVNNVQGQVTGGSGVRGYDQGVYNNVDSAVVLRNDLLAAPVDLGDKTRLQPYLFFDHAEFHGKGSTLLSPTGAQSSSESLSSLGLGVNLQYNQKVNISAVWGHQLDNVAGADGPDRFHIQATWEF